MWESNQAALFEAVVDCNTDECIQGAGVYYGAQSFANSVGQV